MFRFSVERLKSTSTSELQILSKYIHLSERWLSCFQNSLWLSQVSYYQSQFRMIKWLFIFQVCMHAGGNWAAGSDYFYIASTLVTFCLPVILLFIPWWALLVQICGCCTRRLRSSEFWLSLITLFMILFYEASRAPFELFNFHHILTEWQIIDLDPFLPLGESYKAVMKWAVYAPALLHPLLYFTFSPEARHGVYILFSRMCSCCCSKSGPDIEVASDDEKGQMLNAADDQVVHDDAANVPLQSKQEEEMWNYQNVDDSNLVASERFWVVLVKKELRSLLTNCYTPITIHLCVCSLS